jgi:hypothetical protein
MDTEVIGMKSSRKRSVTRLANPPQVTHVYTPDREAMREALRTVLGLPKRRPFGQEVST